MESFRCLPSFKGCLGGSSALRVLKPKGNKSGRRQQPFRNSKFSDLSKEGTLCSIKSQQNPMLRSGKWAHLVSLPRPSSNPKWPVCTGRRQRWSKELCLEKTVVCKLRYKSFCPHLPLRTGHQKRALQCPEAKLVLSTLVCAAPAPCTKIKVSWWSTFCLFLLFKPFFLL